ncbi:hypothetical protein HPB52_006996 [Rhipicephalus sanguineus]|uniref:Glucose-methanol-choline oxidoreductase N-terminal domain-containing protein n=1 Tax=Rhipicephalus sanguineus TaxID=34632 RepID=A0A9D4SRY1_RHISA|nr:hypothetical protein HPB52_006996 [Rhipicephalus sanguineus]
MYEVYATREVVISAGAIGSPQLLMLSGIGPWRDLQNLQPIIDPKYLTHPDDVKAAVEGARIALRLMDSKAMRDIGAKPWDIPLASCEWAGPIWTDSYLACLVHHMAHTTWHPCCTCPMGSDGRAVVDPELKVLGVRSLRVVDASVMPTIVTGNLNVPTMMIAEKAAEMILRENP